MNYLQLTKIVSICNYILKTTNIATQIHDSYCRPNKYSELEPIYLVPTINTFRLLVRLYFYPKCIHNALGINSMLLLLFCAKSFPKQNKSTLSFPLNDRKPGLASARPLPTYSKRNFSHNQHVNYCNDKTNSLVTVYVVVLIFFHQTYKTSTHKYLTVVLFLDMDTTKEKSKMVRKL